MERPGSGGTWLSRGAIAAVLAAATIGLVSPTFAQGSATAAAAAGTQQRRAILDALRPAIEAKLGPEIEFVVTSIDVRDGWAVIMATPQRRGGTAIDPRRYFSPEDLEFMDGLTVTAVMRFQNGRWNHVEHAIGATDVWYCGGTLPLGPSRSFGC